MLSVHIFRRHTQKYSDFRAEDYEICIYSLCEEFKLDLFLRMDGKGISVDGSSLPVTILLNRFSFDTLDQRIDPVEVNEAQG